MSPAEQRNLESIRRIHESAGGLIENARESAATAEEVVWHVPDPSEILPFAGTWRGLEGIAEFERLLAGTMRNSRAELLQYLVGGDHVAAAISTGKAFSGQIVRLYRFELGKSWKCAISTMPRPMSPQSAAFCLKSVAIHLVGAFVQRRSIGASDARRNVARVFSNSVQK